MTPVINLDDYKKFVQGITSKESDDVDAFIARIKWLSENTNINPTLLLTGAGGLNSESGEFFDIVKKITWHNKEVTPALMDHMLSELGDVIWYWVTACRALGFDPNAVIAANIEKLKGRHPDGEFNYNVIKVKD